MEVISWYSSWYSGAYSGTMWHSAAIPLQSALQSAVLFSVRADEGEPGLTIYGTVPHFRQITVIVIQ